MNELGDGTFYNFFWFRLILNELELVQEYNEHWIHATNILSPIQ